MTASDDEEEVAEVHVSTSRKAASKAAAEEPQEKVTGRKRGGNKGSKTPMPSRKNSTATGETKPRDISACFYVKGAKYLDYLHVTLHHPTFWDGKMSMLIHTYPHKPLKTVEVTCGGLK